MDPGRPVSLVATEAALSHPADSRATERLEDHSFEAVYEAHFDFVWRTARRLGVLDCALDDVTQEVFLVVHRRLPTFEPRSSVRAWLFAIVSRVVSESRRSLRRKPGNLGSPVRDAQDFDSVADHRATSPLESLAKTEAVLSLHAVLDAMSREHRDVLILAELEGMAIGDIAGAVGSNVNTVYSRLRAARADFERAVARLRARDTWRLK
jgi:RNA polymerase sigma-70 factor (ECF subfamily)